MIRVAGLVAALLLPCATAGYAGNCIAHWSCGGSRRCASAMGQAYGNAGPFNSLGECVAWANRFNMNTQCDCSGDSRGDVGPSAAQIEQQGRQKEEESKIKSATQSIGIADEIMRNNDFEKPTSNTPVQTPSGRIPESPGQLNFSTSSSTPASNPAPKTQMDFSPPSVRVGDPATNTQLQFSAGGPPNKTPEQDEQTIFVLVPKKSN
jgi:hypothetical protein